jgi:hypothetical protein
MKYFFPNIPHLTHDRELCYEAGIDFSGQFLFSGKFCEAFLPSHLPLLALSHAPPNQKRSHCCCSITKREIMVFFARRAKLSSVQVSNSRLRETYSKSSQASICEYFLFGTGRVAMVSSFFCL